MRSSNFLGVPVPPLFKAEVEARALSGFIEKGTGKVELTLDADIVMSIGGAVKAAPLKLPLTLTTETSFGSVASGRGKRIDSEGRCVLVGVASVPPTTNPIISAALFLPNDVLVSLQSRFEFGI